MKKIVLATHQILDGSRNVENVSYSKEGDEVYVIFSHSASNNSGEFRPTTWDKIVSIFPSASEITFERDSDILEYDLEGKRWKRYGAS